MDDVPAQLKRKQHERETSGRVEMREEHGDDGQGQQMQLFTKRVSSPEAMEKALEKEIPWGLIPSEEKQLFRDAEIKQWDEHIQFGAVRPLSLEESRAVELEVGKERILPARELVEAAA